MKIQAFIDDKWVSTDITTAPTGTLFRYDGVIYTLVSPPQLGANKLWEIPAEPLSAITPTLLLGKKYNYLCMAMDFVGTDCHQFADGTAILAEFEHCDHVYSPRLKMDELLAFCKDNIKVYEKFYDNHSKEVDSGKPIKMERFW